MKRVVFRIISVALVLVALELVLRALGLPAADGCFDSAGGVWVADDELGFKLAPGHRTRHAVLNALSLRGPELAREKPPGTARILFVGDSTAYGQGVALEETFAVRATEALARRFPDVRLEYLIGANPGYSSFQSRVLLERLLAWSPDLVVFYVGARNDHTDGRFYPDSEVPARMARLRAAWHELRLARTAELLRDLFYRRVLRRFMSHEAQARVPPPAFEANLRAMLDATLAAGAQAIVLLPPYSSTLLARRALLPRYQEILARVAAEYGVPSTRLQDAFATHPEAELYSPRDDFHPSALGHALIAAEIERLALADPGWTSRSRGD